MELFFLAFLILLMAWALGSGYPVAFALPGSAIIAIAVAALSGLIFAGETDAFFAHDGPSQWLRAGVTNLRGVYWEVERDTLIAIPLFIFMGIMLQRSKIAEDLLITMAQLFGSIPGGLGISVVFVGALLAATTGIVGATVVAMGMISLPAMMRNNYSKPLATGTIAASGTLGQIIPPSIVLIILADQLSNAVDQASTARKALYKRVTGELQMPSEFDVVSTSAGEMFMGALVPGLVLVVAYMIYILVYSFLRPEKAPAIKNEHGFTRAFFNKLLLAFLPPLLLIFLVLGSIISGVATVNQAGAIGSAGALLMASYRLADGYKYRYLPVIIALVSVIVILVVVGNYSTNIRAIGTTASLPAIVVALIASVGLILALVWSTIRTYNINNTLTDVMIETAKTTSLVFIILLGAAMLTAAFRAFGGEELVRGFLNGLPGGFWTKFIIVMAVIFFLGFFLDFIEIAVVVVPIVAPILLADPNANVTAVWLGVMIGLNIQTSFLTPPFGFALFYLRGVASKAIKTIEIYKGVIPFIIIQLLVLGIVGLNPPLSNYLPNRLSLLSSNASPPRNPKLKTCVQEYEFLNLSKQKNAILLSTDKLMAMDLTSLPESYVVRTKQALDAVGKTFADMGDIIAVENKLEEATPSYRPLHQKVRYLQNKDYTLKLALADLKTEEGRISDETDTGQNILNALRAERANLEVEQKEIMSGIPSNWEDSHKSYQALKLEDKKATLAYNKDRKSAYEPIREVVDFLGSQPLVNDLANKMVVVKNLDASLNLDEVLAILNEMEKDTHSIPDMSKVASKLAKARKALTKETPNWGQALALGTEALSLVEARQVELNQVDSALLPALRAHEEMIRGTIGLRSQTKFDRTSALFVAKCLSQPKDLALEF